MPNMSYCMFENTGREVNQLVGAMRRAEDFDELNLNEYETSAWRDFPSQLAEFLELWIELEQDEDRRDAALSHLSERLGVD